MSKLNFEISISADQLFRILTNRHFQTKSLSLSGISRPSTTVIFPVKWMIQNDADGCPEIPGLLDKSWQNIKTWNLDDVIRTGKGAFPQIVALRNYPRFCPWTIVQPKIAWFPVHAIIDFWRIWISNLLYCSLAPPQEYLPFSTRNSNSNFTSFTATSIALGKIETFFRILRMINSDKPTECVRGPQNPGLNLWSHLSHEFGR